MDYTERHITKIAREAAKLAAQTMKEDGVGPAEYDFIYTVRHHPGITQAELREQLGIDKGAAARRAARLEAKGAVRHEEGGGAKRYFPAVDREDAAAAETESFLSRVYGGSLGLMMSAMVESRQLTEADIAELSAILERAGGEEHA